MTRRHIVNAYYGAQDLLIYIGSFRVRFLLYGESILEKYFMARVFKADGYFPLKKQFGIRKQLSKRNDPKERWIKIEHNEKDKHVSYISQIFTD